MSTQVAPDHELSGAPTSSTAPASLVWPSLAVALLALVGSIWLSVGMHLKACPLCLYPRTFVMGVAGVLAVGMLAGARHRGVLNLLALPSAVGGVGVAAFHEYLELAGKLECPGGVLGLGTAPQQSLAVLAVLLVLVTVGAGRSVNVGGFRWPALAGAFVVGVLFAVGAIVSAPPMPTPPTKAYETPLEMCRPPYRP
jgi:hypothetical protein